MSKTTREKEFEVEVLTDPSTDGLPDSVRQDIIDTLDHYVTHEYAIKR